MGDHTPESKVEVSRAGSGTMGAARRTEALGDDDTARGSSAHAEKKAVRTSVFGGDDGLLSGDTAKARTTAAHGGDDTARGRSPLAGKKEARSSAFLGDDGFQAGDTAARRTAAHGGDDTARGPPPHAEKEAARSSVFIGDHSYRARDTAARRNRDKDSVLRAAASGALPSRRAREDVAPFLGADDRPLRSEARTKKRKEASVLDGVAGSSGYSPVGSSGEVPQGSVRDSGTEEEDRRLIDNYDISVINRTAIGAVGGQIPAILTLAAEKASIEAAAPRMQALARKRKYQMALAGDLPAPSQAPARRRPQRDPAPQPQPDPEPQLQRRPLLQPDQSCPRCHMRTGTVAPHHLCRCVSCSKGTELCPFCFLAALPKTECSRGMCPSCGERPGKPVLDHVCSCSACQECPMCELAKLPRPLRRRDGTCPCCSENEGTSSNHLCLCSECSFVTGSACPYCALAEAPSPIKPFQCIRIEAYDLK